MKPTLALTMGDPAGIGPEIARKALARQSVHKAAHIVFIGDFSHVRRVVPGKPSAFGGRVSGDYIKAAIELAMNGAVQGIVNGPINKISFLLGGWGKKYVGHTEMLAALSGAKVVRSLLVYEDLRAIHVTSHIPLKAVPTALSRKKIIETIVLAHAGLRQMGIRKPRIGVAGLNPHAGDDGVLGNEEKKIIAPAITASHRKKINVEGPISADVLWPMVRARRFDVGVAMYHDQGQIAVKLAGFQPAKNRLSVRGVHVTLGLPFVRTAVDHGTAYDIAGKGVASEESLVDAILLAAKMAKKS